MKTSLHELAPGDKFIVESGTLIAANYLPGEFRTKEITWPEFEEKTIFLVKSISSTSIFVLFRHYPMIGDKMMVITTTHRLTFKDNKDVVIKIL